MRKVREDLPVWEDPTSKTAKQGSERFPPIQKELWQALLR